jgi:hypothetical protein
MRSSATTSAGDVTKPGVGMRHFTRYGGQLFNLQFFLMIIDTIPGDKAKYTVFDN